MWCFFASFTFRSLACLNVVFFIFFFFFEFFSFWSILVLRVVIWTVAVVRSKRCGFITYLGSGGGGICCEKRPLLM